MWNVWHEEQQTNKFLVSRVDDQITRQNNSFFCMAKYLTSWHTQKWDKKFRHDKWSELDLVFGFFTNWHSWFWKWIKEFSLFLKIRSNLTRRRCAPCLTSSCPHHHLNFALHWPNPKSLSAHDWWFECVHIFAYPNPLKASAWARYRLRQGCAPFRSLRN